jgi:hypothetical protein
MPARYAAHGPASSASTKLSILAHEAPRSRSRPAGTGAGAGCCGWGAHDCRRSATCQSKPRPANRGPMELGLQTMCVPRPPASEFTSDRTRGVRSRQRDVLEHGHSVHACGDLTRWLPWPAIPGLGWLQGSVLGGMALGTASSAPVWGTPCERCRTWTRGTSGHTHRHTAHKYDRQVGPHTAHIDVTKHVDPRSTHT